MRLLTVLLIVAAVTTAAPAVAGPALDKSNLFDATAKRPMGDAERIADARLGLSYALRDPETARYRNVSLHSSAWGVVLCGEVNAKNQFGGYIRYQSFVAAGRYVYLDGEGFDAYWFGQAANRFCQTESRVRNVAF